jgi:TolB-like protein
MNFLPKKFCLMLVNIGIIASYSFAGTIENDLNGLFNRLIIADTNKTEHTIAVMPFTMSGTATNETAEQGRALSEYAVSFFFSQSKYKIVEREQLQKVLAELELSQTGLFDDKKALDAGKMLAAQAIVVGSVGNVLGRKMISVRLINTETGTIISAATITVNADAVSNFAREALGEQTNASGALFRSIVVPGWGQFFVKKPVQGSLFLSAAVISAGFLVYSIDNYATKQSKVDDIANGKDIVIGESLAANAARLESAKTARNKAQSTLTIAGSALAVVWIGNIIDAAILGSQNARRVKGLYFSMESRPSATEGIAATVTYRW